jgi:hypothetical protein
MKIKRDYCSWEGLRVKVPERLLKKGEKTPVRVRGDLNGVLRQSDNQTDFWGFFEYPARNHEQGFYEIIVGTDNTENVLRRIEVDYTFNPLYFPPRWENVSKINKFLVKHYTLYVEREILYRHKKFRRDVQLLRVTDPKVSLRKKQVILISGRVHNPESGMTTALYRFVKWLLDGEGKEHLKNYLFLIIPMTIPMTFEEDPRMHNVNREWTADMVESDLIAIRDQVIDKYVPEMWIDCHSFNNVLEMKTRQIRNERGDAKEDYQHFIPDPRHKPNASERRLFKEKCGDYMVAFPVGEKFFDHEYARKIALRLIKVAKAEGHEHMSCRRFFQEFPKGPWIRPGEKMTIETDFAGIFSCKDYASYADRGKYGFNGRDWPAMSCEYGYFRCHAVNFCSECKPLHVRRGKKVYHYSPQYPDSTVVKLKELCDIGLDHFHGQPVSGFPCHLINADVLSDNKSVMLTAWGKDRQELRESRWTLWRNHRSIVLHRLEPKKLDVTLECVRNISVKAMLRFPRPGRKRTFRVKIDGRTIDNYQVDEEFVFVPFVIKQGFIKIEFK